MSTHIIYFCGDIRKFYATLLMNKHSTLYVEKQENKLRNNNNHKKKKKKETNKNIYLDIPRIYTDM